MKKLATTFGLLTLMLIVTSFTTPSEIGGTQGAPRGNGGGTGTDTPTGTGIVMNYEIGGTQGAPRGGGKDTDTSTGGGIFQIGGSQGAPRGGRNTGSGIN